MIRSFFVVGLLSAVTVLALALFLPWYEDWVARGEPPWDPPHPNASRALTVIFPAAILVGLPLAARSLSAAADGDRRIALVLAMPCAVAIALGALAVMNHLNTCANLNFPVEGSC